MEYFLPVNIVFPSPSSYWTDPADTSRCLPFAFLKSLIIVDKMVSKKQSIPSEWLNKQLWTMLKDPLVDRNTLLIEVEAAVNVLRQTPTSVG